MKQVIAEGCDSGDFSSGLVVNKFDFQLPAHKLQIAFGCPPNNFPSAAKNNGGVRF